MTPEEIYSQCREGASVILEIHPEKVRHADLQKLWKMYEADRPMPSKLNIDFLHWITDRVNSKVFMAENARNPEPQAKLEF